jgi:hypothetical protein
MLTMGVSTVFVFMDKAPILVWDKSNIIRGYIAREIYFFLCYRNPRRVNNYVLFLSA